MIQQTTILIIMVGNKNTQIHIHTKMCPQMK